MKFFTRRSFLKLLGMLAFFGGIGSFAAHFNIFSKTAKSIERLAKPAMPDAEFFRQIITVHPEKSRTFMWQSDDERPAQLVELRETGTDSVTVVEAVSEPFTDDNWTGFMHTARINTLRPGTSFEWRVRDGEMLTEWKSISPARPSSSPIRSPRTTPAGPSSLMPLENAICTPTSSSTWATSLTTAKPALSGTTGSAVSHP